MEKKCTIIDISKASGFSKSTVSKVLRNEPFVKNSTKEKILGIIKELGYQPDEIARSLVTGKTINFIGLIISDITNPFFSEVALGVEAGAKKRNCNMILCNTNYDEVEEEKYINILIRNRAVGILLATPKIDDKNIRHLLEINYPFVLITRKVKGIKTNIVTIDHFKSAKMAVNYLIQKGHRKIAHFSGKERVYGIIKRSEGYKAALIENNIKINNKLIFKNAISIEGGYKSAKELLKMNERPTAIFATEDLVAIGAMECLRDNGYKIPEDFSIVGYDNIKITALKSINLTTVNQPKFELGVKSVEILYRQIESGPGFKPITCFLESNIVERGSVLTLNNR
jgi:LacI family transcriptional regulator